MTNREPTMQELAERGETQALENRWLEAIENPESDRQELLDVLNALTKKGVVEMSAALGWSWLATARAKVEPADALTLGRDLLLACGDSPDLRNDVLELYRVVHADRPELESLIEASGLAGGKSPRRALRTLDICLSLKPGDYLIDRSTDHAVRLTAFEPETCIYALRVGHREQLMSPDALTLGYDLVDANDFRVLSQLHPERLTELAEADPAAFIIGVLQSRHGRIDSDHLEPLLCPRVIPAAAWAGWWSRAKTALRRHPNVIVEGRNPVVLTYHAAGQTLEEEIEPQWAKAETPAQRLAVIETYFREAKARRSAPSPAMIRRMFENLLQRFETSRKGAPGHALAEALVIERLAETATLPDGAGPIAQQVIADSQDLVGLLAQLGDPRLYVQAVALLRQALPNRWQDEYLRLLPVAPTEACDAIAQALHEAGRIEDLKRVVADILADIGSHFNAACWLWTGPAVADLEPIPRRDLLSRILEYLNTLTLTDDTPGEILKNARTRIRAALGSANYKHYRRIVMDMDPGMASAVHRTVNRVQGLGHVVHGSLLRIIRDTHPQLFVRARVDPWIDDNIIFCTTAGMQKHEKEMNHLLNVKIPENAKAIGEAASHGDLSENSEFKFALEERDLLQARVLPMQQDLARARIISANDVSTEQVNVGTRVTLVPTAGGAPETFTILGPWEADSEKRIYNYRAPLCSRLQGLKVGDTVTLALDDIEREFRVEAIANALD
ncbi:MAG TPA: GreA/GreB family elongation factor [Phycisphaerae bacterium]|nr:GreA/GreB family elongation factor [Phycisphaerae bacterium]